MNIYQENGYESRKDYLISLSDEYGVSQDKVFLLASMLGKTEDFDGLINMVQDVSIGGY